KIQGYLYRLARAYYGTAEPYARQITPETKGKTMWKDISEVPVKSFPSLFSCFFTVKTDIYKSF
ncbi:MAG TPA: hypothetical protein DCP92_24140, partial [Nitrospiraceae bacterium]|nr:hypothetical protein [Nitrospiraceae bacterium]